MSRGIPKTIKSSTADPFLPLFQNSEEGEDDAFQNVLDAARQMIAHQGLRMALLGQFANDRHFDRPFLTSLIRKAEGIRSPAGMEEETLRLGPKEEEQFHEVMRGMRFELLKEPAPHVRQISLASGRPFRDQIVRNVLERGPVEQQNLYEEPIPEGAAAPWLEPVRIDRIAYRVDVHNAQIQEAFVATIPTGRLNRSNVDSPLFIREQNITLVRPKGQSFSAWVLADRFGREGGAPSEQVKFLISYVPADQRGAALMVLAGLIARFARPLMPFSEGQAEEQEPEEDPPAPSSGYDGASVVGPVDIEQHRWELSPSGPSKGEWEEPQAEEEGHEENSYRDHDVTGDDVEESSEPPMKRRVYGWMPERDLPRMTSISKSVQRPEGMIGWVNEDFFLKYLRHKNAGGWVDTSGLMAETEGTAVGCMVYQMKESKLLLRAFFIRPDYRGRGIGRAMVDTLKWRLSPSGRSRIELYVRERDLPTQIFFRDQGFRRVHTIR